MVTMGLVIGMSSLKPIALKPRPFFPPETSSRKLTNLSKVSFTGSKGEVWGFQMHDLGRLEAENGWLED